MRFHSDFYLAIKNTVEARNPFLKVTSIWGGFLKPQILIQHGKRSVDIPHVIIELYPHVQRHPTEPPAPGFEVKFRLEERVLNRNEAKNLGWVMTHYSNLAEELLALYGAVQVKA